MTIPVVSGSFGSMSPVTSDQTLEQRIVELEGTVRNLLNALSEYSYIPNRYNSVGIASIDDLPDGLSYGRVKVGGVDISDGSIILSGVSGDLDDIANGTHGKVLNSSLTAGGLVVWSAINNDDGHLPADNADVTRVVLSSTNISEGKINLTTSTFDGSLGTTYTAAKCEDATADKTETIIENTLEITSGGITMSAGGKILGGKTSYPDAATAGFYLGYDSGTSKYTFRVGSSTQYLDWDGTNANIVCTGGKIGSSTNYYDITNGVLQAKDSVYAYYTYIDGGNISIRSGTGGAGDAHVLLDHGGIDLSATSGLSTSLLVKGTGGESRIILDVGGTEETNFWVGKSDEAHFIIHGDTTTVYAIKGYTLTSCSIASSQLTGDLPAVSGAALTALNASNLSSGTVDNARIPNLSGKTLTGCDCTNQLGLFVGTATEVKALTGAVTGDIAFATDEGSNGMIVYCDTSNAWRKANTQETI